MCLKIISFVWDPNGLTLLMSQFVICAHQTSGNRLLTITTTFKNFLLHSVIANLPPAVGTSVGVGLALIDKVWHDAAWPTPENAQANCPQMRG